MRYNLFGLFCLLLKLSFNLPELFLHLRLRIS